MQRMLVERRKFLGALPFAAGSAMVLRPSESSVQTQLATIYVSVKDYGAVGDGLADDTVAIQTAINESRLKSLFFPDGVYRISATLVISSEIEIIGAGTPSVTILQTAPSASVFLINNRTNIYSGISISGLVLDCNAQEAGSSYGVDQSVQSGGTVYNLVIRNIIVGSGLTGGIRLQSTFYCIIDNVIVSHVGSQDGGLVLRGFDGTSKIADVRVQNLSVRSGNQGYGIYIGSHAEGLQFFMCLLESNGLKSRN